MANQIACYNHVTDTFKNETTWMYSLDMDEYPFSRLDYCEGFFSRYLTNIQIKSNDSVAAVKLRNFIFLGQGDRSRDIVIDRITRMTPKEANNLVKPVYR